METLRSNHDHLQFILNNYIFERRPGINHTNTDGTVGWRCKYFWKTKCQASFRTLNNILTNYNKNNLIHNHVSETDEALLFNKTQTSIKEKITNEKKTSVNSICVKEIANVIRDNNICINNETSKCTSKILSANSQRKLYYHRLNEVPKLPKNFSEINLPYIYTICNSKSIDNNDQLFKIFQNDNKMIGFASPTQLNIMKSSNWWGADGTFKVIYFI